MMMTKEAKENKGKHVLVANDFKNSLVTEKKIKNYHEFLTNLYLDLIDGPKKLGMNNRLIDAKLPTWLSKILVDMDLIVKTGAGANTLYDWKDKMIEPDEDMAEKLLIAYNKACAESLNRVKTKKEEEKKFNNHIKKNNLVPIDRSKLVEDHLSQREINRMDNIKRFLDYAYKLMNGVSDPIPTIKLKFRDKLKDFHLHPSTLSAIIKIGIFEKHGDRSNSSYKWIDEEPSIKMAHQILISEREYVKGMIHVVEDKKNEMVVLKNNKPAVSNKSKENIEFVDAQTIPTTQTLVRLAKKLIKLKEFDTALVVLDEVPE